MQHQINISDQKIYLSNSFQHEKYLKINSDRKFKFTI